MAVSSVPVPLSRRERLRRQTLSDIKDAARRQIGEAGGAGSLSLNALAKTLGMAGPSLYRYFDSRDALLTELLVDGYIDLADTVEAAVAQGPENLGELDAAALGDRLRDYARLYREWALGNRELYELLFGTPVPGYAAPHAATGPAAARGLVPLIELVDRLRTAGPGAQATGQPDDSAEIALSPQWTELLTTTAADRTSFLVAVAMWARLHGLLTLEIRGHLHQMVAEPQDLFDREVEHVIAELSAS